jgi:hypothetical protein
MSSEDRVRLEAESAIRLAITLEVTVIEGNTNAVQTKALEELSICVLEEVLQELRRS